jgi:K(+)-stimulated pyrophosphate-energized sodium pump
LLGTALTGAAGFAGMHLSFGAGTRIAAQLSGKEQDLALGLIARNSRVIGLLLAGLAVLGVAGYYAALQALGAAQPLQALAGVAFGAALAAWSARLGGDAFALAVRSALQAHGDASESEAQNPLRLAESAADYTDWFASYLIALIAAMFLGSVLSAGASGAIVYPLAVSGATLVAALLGGGWVALTPDAKILGVLRKQVLVSSGIALILLFPASLLIGAGGFSLGGMEIGGGRLFFSALAGFALAALVANALGCNQSRAFLRKVAAPALLAAIALWFAHQVAGPYGLAIAVLAVLSMACVMVSLHAYGLMLSHTDSLASMAGLPQELREAVAHLQARDYCAKGYSLGAASLAALLVFAGYIHGLGAADFLLSDYRVVFGLLIGGMAPYGFSHAMAKATTQAADYAVAEAQNRIQASPSNYAQEIDTLAKAAIGKMLLPTLAPIFLLLLAAWILGKVVLGGILISAIITGLCLMLATPCPASSKASASNALIKMIAITALLIMPLLT